MSTRATYRFHDDPTVTIYKHHDGYPKGAACWLYNAWRCRARGLAAGFLRGNEDAELTVSHEIHCDTEYRYDLKPDKDTPSGWSITVQERQYDKWRAVPGPDGGGDLVEWITARVVPDFIADYSPILRVAGRYRAAYLTAAEVTERRDKWIELLDAWKRNGVNQQEGNANRLSLEADVRKLESALEGAAV